MLFTVLILAVYMVGRTIPLYGIDTGAYAGDVAGADEVLMQVIGGDTYQHSLFALGISPYIISSLVTQIVLLCMGEKARAKVSPKKLERITLVLTFLLALLQAVNNGSMLKFSVTGEALLFVRLVAMLEMVTGAMVVLMLSNMNKRYGIGGQTVLIIFNIVGGIARNIRGCTPDQLPVPLLISAVVAAVILVMENTEKRFPLQRVSIHNIYADKNYLAIKHNPIGVMPVMFSTAFFMIPRLLVSLLCLVFPDNTTLIWWQENLDLTRPLGIAVYIFAVYLLTVGFSFVFINPKDTTEQLLKGGDSIVNIHAGRETGRYLRKNIFRISFFSATVMGVCLGFPLLLQLKGSINGGLAMLPSSFMMLTGVACNFGREGAAIRRYDAYRQFIFT